MLFHCYSLLFIAAVASFAITGAIPAQNLHRSKTHPSQRTSPHSPHPSSWENPIQKSRHDTSELQSQLSNLIELLLKSQSQVFQHLHSFRSSSSKQPSDFIGTETQGTKKEEERRNSRRTRESVAEYIVDGEAAGKCDWPWHVAVTVEDGRLVCGATLIDSYWLLSAAHCFNDLPMGLRLYAQLGAYNLTARDQIETIDITDIMIHEDYQRDPLGYNDVALLRLDTPAGMTHPRCVRPAKLVTPLQADFAETASQCYVIGWGKTNGSSAQTSSEVLMQKRVSILSNTQCQSRWDQSLFGKVRIYPQNICVDSLGGDGLTTCQGDSGSPLQCYTRATGWIVIGPSSWGSSACKKFPSVYMREAMFYDWIQLHIRLTSPKR